MSNPTIAAELRRLERNGRLTPQRVVEAAKSKKSPLHEFFEWNDVVAAEAYRLDQARALIRTVGIRTETATRTATTVRYWRDPDMPANEQGYVTVDKMREDPKLALRAITLALNRVAILLQPVQELAVVLGFEPQIDELLANVASLRRLVGGSDHARPS